MFNRDLKVVREFNTLLAIYLYHMDTECFWFARYQGEYHTPKLD